MKPTRMTLALLAGFFLMRLASAQTFTEIHAFEATSSYPPYPNQLVQGRDGNFYGTTRDGGTLSQGTAFKITPAGILTTLVEFTGPNGRNSQAPLIQGRDGHFYGTTVLGGASDDGTVFRMTADGALSTLVSFDRSNGGAPLGHVIEVSDGLFYGTTSDGGAQGHGTVFKMTAGGTLTTLVSFSGSNGRKPYAGLLLSRDGNFYGTTHQGGGADFGTVFRMSPEGALTMLAAFDGANGRHPRASLIQLADEHFYGTTAGDAHRYWGTVFKMSPDGTLTSLVPFEYPNGVYPMAPLTLGSDGNLYGTTYGNGFNTDYQEAYGTLFRITLAGTLTTLFSFGGSDTVDRTMRNGGFPTAGLVLSPDGNFYGTTTAGGSRGAGNVFRLNVGFPARPVLGLSLSNHLVTLRWTSQPGRRYRPQFKTDLASSSWVDLAPDITATNTTAALTNNVSGTASRYYRVLVVP